MRETVCLDSLPQINSISISGVSLTTQFSSLRKHLERHGELPARLGQIGPIVIHRTGRAAVQVERVHAAEAQHQLPHLLDGRAGDGSQHQLPSGVDADGGAGRDGGGEAGLLEPLLQRGGDSPVLDQPGRAGDDADKVVQDEALRVRRVEVNSTVTGVPGDGARKYSVEVKAASI